MSSCRSPHFLWGWGEKNIRLAVSYGFKKTEWDIIIQFSLPSMVSITYQKTLKIASTFDLKAPNNTVCQNTSVSECSRVPKVQDFDNILRTMCQSHYLTISPPGLIFWEMLSNASPLTSCNRNTLFLLLLALSCKQNFHFLSLVTGHIISAPSQIHHTFTFYLL